MIRTIIYLIIFILTLIFLFQNGSIPVSIKFLRWETSTPIPVGFVIVFSILIGGVIVWLYNLPKILSLKGRIKSLDRKITLLMEDIKRKEKEIEEIKKSKDELEKKTKEVSQKEDERKIEENVELKEEEKKEEIKGNIFSIFKRKKRDEDKKSN